MAKKKSKTVLTSFNIAEQIRSGASKDDFLLTQEEIDTLDRGIPLTGMLPLQGILRVNVLPLQHFFTITGVKGIGKSLLLWEFMKIVVNYGGLGVYIGTETNENVPQQKRILNISPHSKMSGILYYKNTNNLEKFKVVMLKSNAQIEELDPEGIIPVFIGIDSFDNISNKKARRDMDTKELKNADKENRMSAAHKAKKVKEFLLEFQINYLNERPVTIAGINHWQTKIDITGMAKGGYTPGGVFKDYLNSSELHLARVGIQNKNSGNSPFDVKFRNKKQACGPIRKLDPVIPFIDWKQTDEETGEEYNCCGYDWDTGLTKLLMSSDTNKAQRKEILDIKKEGQVYSSETLGCKEVSAKEFGHIIHSNPDICDKIRKMYTISEYAMFPKPE